MNLPIAICSSSAVTDNTQRCLNQLFSYMTGIAMVENESHSQIVHQEQNADISNYMFLPYS